MISIIIPVYNEEHSIFPLYKRVHACFSANGIIDYEFVFIDDGSTDNSAETIKQFVPLDNVKFIRFQRNFGKSAALNAGFAKCKGDIIITMDADLQDDPLEIPKFVDKINSGYDLVSGWKYKRHDPLSKIIPSKIFNWLTSVSTGVKLHDFNCGFKAYKKEVVKNIELYGELHRFVPVLAAMKGYKIGEIKVKHHKRRYGKTKFGTSRLIKGAFDLLTVTFFSKYAKRPLHFFGGLSLLFFIFGLVGGVYLLLLKAAGVAIGQRPMLILVALLFIMATQFVSLGLLAEMIIKNNPEKGYVIKEENEGLST